MFQPISGYKEIYFLNICNVQQCFALNANMLMISGFNVDVCGLIL